MSLPSAANRRAGTLARLAWAVGALAVVGAVVLAYEPSLAAGLRPGMVSVTLVGVLALLLGARAVRVRLASDGREGNPPETGQAEAASVPGTGFDRLLAGRPGPDAESGLSPREAVGDRLGSAAVEALARYEGLSRADARDALASGTWTEDGGAAAFFTGEAPDTSLAERLRRSLALAPALQRRATRAVAEVAAIAPIRTGDGAEPGGAGRAPATGGPTATTPEPVDRLTRRWRGVSGLVMLSLGGGVVLGRPGLVLAGVVGVGYAAMARAARPPEVSLELERTLREPEPAPGTEVTVRVTVRNAGESLLPDLRVVDGVPPALAVTDGTPRLGTALRPGESATVAYAVRATRGEHVFDPATVFARDASGAVEREVRVAAPEATVLTCEPRLARGRAFPLRAQASRYVGRVTTDAGGSGVEFHSVREYRPGDPHGRIDWNRAARTGELSTLQFREERAATVVLLVDAREEAYVAPAPDEPSAVDRSVEAAGEVFTALLDAGDRVGVAALAPRTCWLGPASGGGHRARARHLLATHPALSPARPERPFYPSVQLRRLRRRLPGDAQVVLFAPLADDYVVSVARRLDAYGHPVTVVSPDPTAASTPGRTLARVERALRLSALREADVRAVDWERDATLATAVARAERRWSR